MEPFSITCTTCKSRLKVRSAAAVGQVVSCPKCGGMVLIKLPDEIAPEIANAATKPVDQRAAEASPSNTKEFDDVEAILAGKSPAPATASPRNDRPADRGQPAAAERKAEPVKAPAAATSAIPADAARAAEDDPSPKPAEALPADALPVATAIQPRRYVAWLAASILAGIFLAVAVVVVSGRLLRDRGKEVAAKNSPVQKEQERISTSETAGRTAVSPTPAERPSPSEDSAAGQPAKIVTPAVEAPASPAKAVSPAKAKTTEPVPPPAKDEDPLQIAGPTKGETVAAKPAPAANDDPLGKFADVLNGGNADPLPPAAETAPAEKPGVESPAEAAARPSMPRPPPRIVNVSARLDDPLPGIDVPGVPLSDFLAELSSLSTIPITLLPEGLALAEVTPESPVSLKLENTTVGKALAEALRPLHLEYEIVEDQLIVSLGAKLNERSIAVDDLTGNQEQQAQQLAELATTLVDPSVWTEGDDEAGATLTPGRQQFAVRVSNRTYAGLLLFFEKLRVARGLPPRIKRQPELFRLQSRTDKAREKLATPITLNYSQPTVLPRILDRLAQSAKVRILIDWQALASQDWNPDGEGTMVVENKPLSEALDALLVPMELSWRVVDENTLQVTSAAAAAQTLDLEFYPAKDLAADAAAGEALLGRLQSALAESGEEPGRVLRFDPVGLCILANCPQVQQRQIERLLAQWRSVAKSKGE